MKAPFPRISYDEAVKILNEKGQTFEWGGDLGGTDETILSQQFDRPVAIHRYPAKVKPFYMEPDPVRPELALCVDILAPEGIGEIIGGSQRLASYDTLLQRIKDHNLPQEAFEWYLDLRRFGSVPHAGFGMGIERVVGWICGLEHVREATPFPRMMYGVTPMKIGFVSLGCPKNLVDSEVMMGLSQEGGHTLTPNRGCRRPGRQHLRVHRLGQRGVDQHHPRTGRVQEDRQLQAPRRHRLPGRTLSRRAEGQIPEIDAVLGTGDMPEIVGAIEGRNEIRIIPLTLVRGGPKPRTPIPDPCRRTLRSRDPRVFTTPRHFAYIKVAEGCDYKCSFCIIPTLRGHYRSRPVDTIVREAGTCRARRPRADSDLPGHHLLRAGSGRRRGAGRAAARAQRRGRHRLDPLALPLPDDHH